MDQPKQKSTAPTMAQKKTKKEQATHGKVTLQKKLAAQRSKEMDTKVSLHDGDGSDNSTSEIEEAAEASGQTTDDEEGSIQSNKDSKRKSTPPNIQATKRPKKLLVSSENSKQRRTMSDHARNQKGRQDTDNSTVSEKGENDEDKDNQKQHARKSPTIKSLSRTNH